ncbi:MAG: hypothetical protein H8D26_01680, partial [Methanomicrobia archaeon]|nr:hypothetical protein [Methanomicrobia archaeon]
MEIGDLERMNKLPKTIASPEMDLEKLKGMEEYIRRQWWDGIKRVEGEYLTKFVPEGETNGFLEANIAMSKLKLVVSFLDNGERCPEHGFKDDQMGFVRNFDEFKIYDILSENEIAEYVRRGREDERGIVRLAKDAALKGYDQMDRIIGSKIRGDLALAFKRIYSDRLKKMEFAATEYIIKYGIGPGGVWEDIEGAIAKSAEERGRIIEGINQSLSELETSLKGEEEVKEGGMRLEGILRRLEREVVEKEKGKEALNSRLIEFEGDKREVWGRYEKLKNAWDESIAAIERRKKTLDARELELKEAEERQRAELKDTARQAFENELRNINTLREELEKKEAELKGEREGVEYDKREVEERLGKLKAILEGGEVKRFVTRDVAKIQELNYVSRFDVKMIGVPRTIYDPIERKEWKIRSRSRHHRFNDVDIILASLKMNYEEAMRKLPLNLRSRYVVAEKKYKLFGKEETKVIIEAAVLGHLLDYAENGFDTRSVTLSELLSVLTRYIDNAELGNYFHVLGIASVTGFDKKVFEHVNSGDFHKNFVSRYVSLCLVDLETGEVFYNESDERI